MLYAGIALLGHAPKLSKHINDVWGGISISTTPEDLTSVRLAHDDFGGDNLHFMRQAPLFWGKSHGKNQSVYSKGSKTKNQLDPLKFGSHETTQPGCNFGQLKKASPRWIWCSFLNFNEPNMEGENETSLKVCSVFFHTYKLRTRPDSSKNRIFDMSQRSSVLKLQNQLKWKPQLRVCVPGSINSLYWR